MATIKELRIACSGCGCYVAREMWSRHLAWHGMLNPEGDIPVPGPGDITIEQHPTEAKAADLTVERVIDHWKNRHNVEMTHDDECWRIHTVCALRLVQRLLT